MIAGVHHVAFRTRDVEALARFYRAALGLRVEARKRDPRGVLRSIWLRAGATIVMIERRERGEPRVDAATMEAVLFAISAADRARFERRLARAGAPVEHRTGFTLYARDPDGRRIGVSHFPEPAPAAEAAASKSTTARPKTSRRGRRGA